MKKNKHYEFIPVGPDCSGFPETKSQGIQKSQKHIPGQGVKNLFDLKTLLWWLKCMVSQHYNSKNPLGKWGTLFIWYYSVMPALYRELRRLTT